MDEKIIGKLTGDAASGARGLPAPLRSVPAPGAERWLGRGSHSIISSPNR